MRKSPLTHITPRLAIIVSVFCLFMACTKEYSLENGGFSGTAQGELVDSLGNCKNVTIRGTYVVDTALTNNNYVLVNVNFTSTGKYKIYTDTVNGMWFLDSGFAVSTGASVVKIKGKGTPILGKKTVFALIFNNNLCSFSITPTGTGGTGGGSGGGGTGSNGDYFPTTSGSFWTYQYIPTLGTIDTFNVTVAQNQVLAPSDTLLYSQFGTSLADTFYFAKDGLGTYYAYSTIDFDYTFLFDSIPDMFIRYPFLKDNVNVGATWDSDPYGKVRIGTGTGAVRGMAKATFTIISKNTATHTVGVGVGSKTYSNVINVQRDIKFLPDGGSAYQLLISGNSYYAKDYGLIDQVIITSSTTTQAVSLFRTPTIK